MNISEEQRAEFERIAKPVIEWMNNNCHPHTTVVITTTTAELSEGIATVYTEEFIKG